MLVFRVIYPADYLPDPVLIDEREKITAVFLIQNLSDVVFGYAGPA